MDVMLWIIASGQDMGEVGIQRSERVGHTLGGHQCQSCLCPPPLPPGMSRISAEKP